MKVEISVKSELSSGTCTIRTEGGAKECTTAFETMIAWVYCNLAAEQGEDEAEKFRKRIEDATARESRVWDAEEMKRAKEMLKKLAENKADA